MKSATYYYIKHRTHCLRFILSLTILSNCIIAAVVAGLYERPDISMVLSGVAIASLLVAMRQHKHCISYYNLIERSKPQPRKS
jgi:hypothetical protein